MARSLRSRDRSLSPTPFAHEPERTLASVASMRAKVALVGVPVAIVLGAGSLGLAAVHSHPHSQTSAGRYDTTANNDYGSAPSFAAFTDQTGRKVGSADLAGRVQIVSFLFPYCTTYCPAITRTLLRLEQELKKENLLGARAVLVSFNVDPQHTGVPQMRQYFAQYGVNPGDGNWHYLTGNPAVVAHVVRDGYHVYYQAISLAQEQKEIAEQRANGIYTPAPFFDNKLTEKVRPKYDVVHNDVVYVVDQSGTIRTVFAEGSQVTLESLLAAVRRYAAAS